MTTKPLPASTLDKRVCNLTLIDRRHRTTESREPKTSAQGATRARQRVCAQTTDDQNERDSDLDTPSGSHDGDPEWCAIPYGHAR